MTIEPLCTDRRPGAAGACGALLLMLFATQVGSAATAPSLDGGLSYSADVLNSDFRTNTLEIAGNVRVTQGPMSIEAQSAKARNMQGNNYRWTFENAVRIRSEEADLQSNLATAVVVNGQIADARVEGTPARFEQLGTANRQVRGRAEVIEYDFGTGIIKLTNQVWFSNGKDEFRGDVVIYNVRDERLQVNPGGTPNRVRGILRPKQNKNEAPKLPGQAAKDSSAAGAAAVEPSFEDGLDPQLATDGGGE
jgi:lipopolysaccharide transport protein LptA